jgi:hypothetical protein
MAVLQAQQDVDLLEDLLPAGRAESKGEKK